MKNATPQITKHVKWIVGSLWLAPIFIMLIISAACSQISNHIIDQRISEGMIEYQITFPTVSEESITASLLPDRMMYAFKENGFSSNFETAGGVFKNRIIADNTTKTLEHQIKVFRKKIKVKMNETDINQMISQYPKMSVIQTGEVDTIAGYHCEKALIVFEDVESKEIEVFYTRDIKMKSPNWCTQYHEIDGVLMAYEIEQFGIRMRLEAISVQPLPEDPEVMEPDEEYSSISKEMMDIELAQLVETFEL